MCVEAVAIIFQAMILDEESLFNLSSVLFFSTEVKTNLYNMSIYVLQRLQIICGFIFHH